MSSLVKRLRTRSERKPLYNDDEFDDDLELVHGGRGTGQTKTEQISRADAKDGLCQACGESGSLLSCETCTYAYHMKCLLPPLKVPPVGSWSCPECVSPLNEIDKILDCEMRPTGADENEASKLGSKQKFVKQYLVKWKGLSYLHCTWVPEKKFLKAFKANPRLRSKVNNFHKQMDSTSSSGDDWVSIRPEWTTVDRIIATRLRYYVKSCVYCL
ncbi:CHD3-type chromatin-remodeling factor PICKLE-like [Aristolochia californica]|uniref:CHD3-type chromatin-remodeling factor PICKLE-like n=1 Tax=Aristolochia californica TaxID=171875 RepID=UPI0035E0D794